MNSYWKWLDGILFSHLSREVQSAVATELFSYWGCKLQTSTIIRFQVAHITSFNIYLFIFITWHVKAWNAENICIITKSITIVFIKTSILSLGVSVSAVNCHENEKSGGHRFLIWDFQKLLWTPIFIRGFFISRFFYDKLVSDE
jgi:hypothetical protein